MTKPQSETLSTVKHVLSSWYGTWQSTTSEPEIDRALVASTSISSIGYDKDQDALQVEYTNGVLYRIDGVTSQTYLALMEAENFDQFFRQEILPGFKMTKIGAVMPMGR